MLSGLVLLDVTASAKQDLARGAADRSKGLGSKRNGHKSALNAMHAFECDRRLGRWTVARASVGICWRRGVIAARDDNERACEGRSEDQYKALHSQFSVVDQAKGLVSVRVSSVLTEDDEPALNVAFAAEDQRASSTVAFAGDTGASVNPALATKRCCS